MSTSLPPWANGPFELLVHAEGHLASGEDFDRRIGLISFDNAIEVAITTYLTLNPIQRGGRTYQRADVERWLANYHSKLEFLGNEITNRHTIWQIEKSYIIWIHDHRNEQYHGGHKGAPEKTVLKIAREAALWVFGLLFEVDNVDLLLKNALLELAPPPPPVNDRRLDLAIDRRYGVIEVCEQSYYASELLFAVDHFAYRDLGERLCETPDDTENGAIGGEGNE